MLALDREQLADGFCLGFQPLHAALGGGERLARGIDLGAGLGMRDFGAARGGFGLGERGLRGGERGAQRRQIGLAAAGRDQAGFDIGKLGLKPRTALLVIGQRGLQLIAPRREIGQRAGQFGKGFFRSRKRGVRLGDARVDAGQALGAGMGFGGERGLLEIEPVQRRFGVGCEFALARKIGGKLLEPAIELLDALLGAGFLALERLARDDEPLQCRGRPGLGLAQRRQAGRDLGLARIGQRLLAGARGNDAHGLVPGPLGSRRPRSARRASAGETTAPRCGAPGRKYCGSAPPGGPGSSAKRPAPRAGR